MKIAIEIRPGEGGDDAKLLVEDQAAIYLNYAKRIGIDATLQDESRS
jgi:protein subunit release factor A